MTPETKGRKVKQGHKARKEYRVSKVKLDLLDHKEKQGLRG